MVFYDNILNLKSSKNLSDSGFNVHVFSKYNFWDYFNADVLYIYLDKFLLFILLK